eukprot:CAMPEP_0177616012 /NCGR_PEP_ID=MMETSP0419_2-20121207/23856_1 /TAXON_ID=582737 /ORGANISM="Tetraselmis sp., Strain GSL018" /LENGTH=49 /DNA_ID= /DNA_START= /DNA_END= /DNA_ORIENTATION=
MSVSACGFSAGSLPMRRLPGPSPPPPCAALSCSYCDPEAASSASRPASS